MKKEKKMKKSQRTYYGFQLGSPCYPGGMDIVTTEKPTVGYQVKCRASSVAEAEEKLNQIWAESCMEALTKTEK
jgi:hypothetical protein